MQKEHTFKEISFLSYKIRDISAVWTEFYLLHMHRNIHSYTVLLYLLQWSDLVKVQHYDFRCLCRSFCCWTKSDMTQLIPFTKKGKAHFWRARWQELRVMKRLKLCKNFRIVNSIFHKIIFLEVWCLCFFFYYSAHTQERSATGQHSLLW